jgi:hypothetical protein
MVESNLVREYLKSRRGSLVMSLQMDWTTKDLMEGISSVVEFLWS